MDSLGGTVAYSSPALFFASLYLAMTSSWLIPFSPLGEDDAFSFLSSSHGNLITSCARSVLLE